MIQKRYLALFLISLLMLTGCKKDTMIEETRLMMGTIVNIKVPYVYNKDIKEIMNKSFSRIKNIERLLNRFDKDSQVSSINRLGLEDELKLDPETVFVLKRSLELNRLTDGAFDITISPLVELWGFYEQKGDLPSGEEIRKILPYIGSENILLKEAGTIRVLRQGVKIDLSGIAKGYAVDEAIRVLKENGIENGLVEAGGDMYCLGRGPKKSPWRIGIMHPRKDELLGALTVSDKAVATSGDYQKFFIKDKKRYSHIIDPRTGYPISDIPASVTVIANDCITADGLATAISVMGPTDGLKFIEEFNDVEAIVVSDLKDELKIDASSGIKDYYESFQR